MGRATFIELDAADQEFSGERPDPWPPRRGDGRLGTAIVDDARIGPRRPFARGEITVGRLPHRIAYLQIASFSDYTADNRTAAGLAELDRALDLALRAPITGLVIDIRRNDGRSDIYGVAVAARLTRTPYPAYAKTARNNPDDPTRFTAPQPVIVEPADPAKAGPVFTGPVALLTSRYSVSAAETFAQAMLGRPGVTRIGEHTQGVFSDVLIRTLPNGTVFGLSNEVYTTGGRVFEGPGLAPDLDTGPVFRPEDLDAGRDHELSAAIRILRRHK